MVSITIECPAVAQESLPGQFVQVRAWPGVGQAADPLLDRPLSIAGADPEKGTFELIVRVVGRGTSLLAETEVGQALRVIGPLGTGFPVAEGTAGAAGAGSGPAVLVGGGVGVAPMKFLAQTLERQGRQGGKGREVLFLVGARDAAELPPAGALVGEVRFATDDGSAGYHGTAVGLLKEVVQPASGQDARPVSGQAAGAVVYACGPTPMLRAVKSAAAELGVPAYLSLEERMACGIGACRGCAVRYIGPGTAPDEVKMVRVCHEGPVFAAGEVDLDA